jgi:hypothetical protein
MRMFVLPLLLLLMGFSWLSCEENPPADLGDEGYAYYPAEAGQYRIYQVDSMVWDDFTGDSSSYKYQIKELFDSSFIDGEGRKALRAERWRRDSVDGLWYPAGTFAAVKTDLRVEEQRENLRYIKLAFPLQLGHSWDVNALNNLGELECEIIGFDEPKSIGTMNHDSTMSVLHQDLRTAISNDYKIETYAKGIGLVYLEERHLETSVTGIIESGVDYTYILLESGKE